MPSPSSSAASVFRADKFLVPAPALTDFLKQVERVDAELSTLPGCEQHLVLIQEAHPGEDVLHVLTVVEWASAAHLSAAKTHMQRHYAQQGEGVDPAALLRRLGVQAEMGVYRPAQAA